MKRMKTDEDIKKIAGGGREAPITKDVYIPDDNQTEVQWELGALSGHLYYITIYSSRTQEYIGFVILCPVDGFENIRTMGWNIGDEYIDAIAYMNNSGTLDWDCDWKSAGIHIGGGTYTATAYDLGKIV